MSASIKHYLVLNLIVLIWGFTGVLGDQISLGSAEIVFFRMGIAAVSLGILSAFIKTKPLTNQQRLKLVLIGFVVAFHWLTFFYSIKVSTVSIGVVCMSSSTLFTAIIEPIVFKKKHAKSEFLLSFGIVAGIAIIFGFEPEYTKGITFGLISAFLASIFNVLNGKYIESASPLSITLYEMIGGFIVISALLVYIGQFNADLFTVPSIDWIYLLILGLVCTTMAFLVSVWIMKYVSPFTVSLSINLEPVYAIIIAIIVAHYQGKNTENMTMEFYIGTIIILSAIFINAYLKSRKNIR